MATKSFYEDLVLDTPEAVANMEEAFRKFDKYGGYKAKNQVVLSNNFERFERMLGKEEQ